MIYNPIKGFLAFTYFNYLIFLIVIGFFFLRIWLEVESDIVDVFEDDENNSRYSSDHEQKNRYRSSSLLRVLSSRRCQTDHKTSKTVVGFVICLASL